MQEPLRLGIAGLGTVGTSVIRLLNEQGEALGGRIGRGVKVVGGQRQGPGARPRHLA